MAKRVAVAVAITLTLAPLVVARGQNADSVTTLRATEALTRIRRYTTSDVNMARLIADSLVRALPNDASVMAEALFAKASIAPNASDAEKDYARIVNEYRFASRVPDALMRLALLEGARNNRPDALRHLDRLLRDHSESAVRSRASLMAGRLRMEMNDPARGCELLAAAWASAGITERDVKDQAEQLGAKCPVSVAERAQRDPAPLGILRAGRDTSSAAAAPVGVASTAATRRRQRDSVQAAQAAAAAVRRDSLAKVAAGAKPPEKPATRVESQPDTTTRVAAASASAAVPVVPRQPRTPPAPKRDSVVPAPVRRDSTPRPVVRRDSVMPTAARRDSTPASPGARRDSLPKPVARRDTTPKAVVRRDSAPASPGARRDSLPKPVVRRDTTPKPVVRRDSVPASRPVAPPVRADSTRVSSAPAATRYAVQFAAYNDRPDAEEFAALLQQRGIAARVEGTAKPFRVRAGRFGTRVEAEAQAAVWRRPGQAAIVVSYP